MRQTTTFDWQEGGHAVALWIGLLFAAVFMLVALIVFGVFASTAANAETCIASVYGVHDADQTGTRTASGIPLNDGVPSVAHKTAKLRSYLTVTNLGNGKSIRLQVTDRGPFVRGRCVDLSHAAARAIGINGLGKVRVE